MNGLVTSFGLALALPAIRNTTNNTATYLFAAILVTSILSNKRSPSTVIHKSHEVKIPAPFAASFSSRCPNQGSQHILKPDIAAPGINILASYTPMKSITGQKGDTQFSEFTLMSRTSMSCPHVAGVAAYVKSFHPDWTPAAIRSVIITTGWSLFLF